MTEPGAAPRRRRVRLPRRPLPRATTVRGAIERALRRVRIVHRRRVAPVLGVVSPIGWSLAATAVAAFVAGSALHVTELRILAVVLAVPLVVAAVFVLGRASYRVTMDLSSARVVVGERAIGRVEVANASSHLMLASRIELAVGTATAQFLVPRLAPDRSHEELFAIPTRRRSVLVVGPVRSVRDDPLALMRRQVTWARAQEVYVHPRTARLPGFESGYLRDLEGTPSSALSSSDIAFHALRPYQSGDDLRHVHWRTTARTGTLMVRQFEETRRSHIVVALANDAAHFAHDEEFELAVSAAASLCAQTQREEKELTALSIGSRLRSASPRRLMDDFTVLDAVRGRSTLRDLGRSATDSAPNASAVILVVGSGATPAELMAAGTQLLPGVGGAVVRCVDGEGVRRSQLGPLQLVTIGELDQLARALRAVAR